MNILINLILFSLNILFLCGCQGKQQNNRPTHLNHDLEHLYLSAGIPELPKNDRIKKTQPKISSSLKDKDTSIQTNTFKKTKKISTKKTSPSKKPWTNNNPISPSEGQRLIAIREQAWEYYWAAKEGEEPKTNWLKGAQNFLKASRVPDTDWRVECLYNAACCYSLAGDKKKALACLSLSIKLGFGDFDHIQSDPDLDSLRQEKKYLSLMKKHSEKGLVIPPSQQTIEKAFQQSRAHLDEKMTLQQARETYQKGNDCYKSKQYEQAANYYLQCAEFLKENEKKNAYYDAACCWALQEKPQKALEALKLAIDSGWSDFNYMKKDNDLKSLKDNLEFKKLLP